ncbi:MAG: lysophospholipid acyltransferase family protein [Burkholderiales bacterium]|nr:lysophospholipid acyltransferase family protein [Burkholderiales bacterium]
MRVAIKLLRGIWHVLVGWFTIYFRFPQLAPAQREARVQAWAMQLLRIWDIDLEVRGKPIVTGPALLVSNHISWLDILVIHATRHCRFVSKSELREWPLIGTLATGAGTLYIERENRKDAMRMVKEMTRALNNGDVLAVFPEGTTGDGLDLLPFHANLLQSAIDAQAPAQPLALQFIDAQTNEISMAARFVGDDTLVSSIWSTLNAKGLKALVNFGEIEMARGQDRRAWAQTLRGKVVSLKETCRP